VRQCGLDIGDQIDIKKARPRQMRGTILRTCVNLLGWQLQRRIEHSQVIAADLLPEPF
jgi:hypothetical protein